MINRVKYLQEELSRHDPEKYLDCAVIVKPLGATISVALDSDLTDEEKDNLEIRVKELADCCLQIQCAIKSDKFTLDGLKEQIKSILIKFEAI